MNLNRRAMLTASIGAVALGLSGCNKKNETVVIWYNAPPVGDKTKGFTVPIALDAAAGGAKGKAAGFVSIGTIAPGAGSHQVWDASDRDLKNAGLAVGQKLAVTGTITPKGKPKFAIPGGLFVVIGKTNTFWVDSAKKVFSQVS